MSALAVFELSGGEITLWADVGSVMLKVRDASGDPIELGEGEVDELIGVLTALRSQIA